MLLSPRFSTSITLLLLLQLPRLTTSQTGVCNGVLKQFSYKVNIEVKASGRSCSRADDEEIAKVINDNFDRAFQFNGQTAVVKMESDICAVGTSNNNGIGRAPPAAGVNNPCSKKCFVEDFNQFQKGDYVKFINTTDYSIKVEAMGNNGGYTPDNKARVFDTRDPKGDAKLGHHPEEGNALIIQSSNKAEPDDYGAGGYIKFEFLSGFVELQTVTLLDINTSPGKLEVVIGNHVETKDIIPKLTAAGVKQDVPVSLDNVKKVKVVLANSAAVARLNFCVFPCRKSHRRSLLRAPQQEQEQEQEPIDDYHRQLYWGRFFYRGSGLCTLCYYDNEDHRKRRRLMAEADTYSDNWGHIFTITKDTEDVETVAAQAVNGDIVKLEDAVSFNQIIPALEVNEADFIQELLFEHFKDRNGHCLQNQYAYVKVTIIATPSYMPTVC